MEDHNSIHNSLLFYSFLKKIVAADSKLTPKQQKAIHSKIEKCKSIDDLKELLRIEISSKPKLTKYLDLIQAFHSFPFVVDSFKSAIHFINFKDYILNEVRGENEILDDVIASQHESSVSSPAYKLTCAYDTLSALQPYKNRVFAVWVLNNKFEDYFKDLSISKDYINYFQIQLDESIKQSGISNSGANYESRIRDLFSYHDLDFTLNSHEEEDQSQEHDLMIDFKGFKIGVGAKRTLRERYKQYNPKEVDFSLVFTIGEDLNKSKANTITNIYKSHIFVADEVYDSSEYMKINKKIHKVTSFSSDLLNEIVTSGDSIEH